MSSAIVTHGPTTVTEGVRTSTAACNACAWTHEQVTTHDFQERAFYARIANHADRHQVEDILVF